jgi:hypothetical protein
MARTTTALVEKLLSDNYDTFTNLQQFVDAAYLVINRVATCASAKGKALNADELEMIERWYAAHLYTKNDPTYSSRSTGGSSGAFVRDPKVPEPYLKGALDLDFSGCLAAIVNRSTTAAFWLGRPPSAQTPYEDRR